MYHNAINTNLKAVVIGATSGIGQGCAHRLAEQGYTVLAIGRPGPGRAEQIIEELTAKSKSKFGIGLGSSMGIPAHEFYATDAFSLQQVHQTAQEILSTIYSAKCSIPIPSISLSTHYEHDNVLQNSHRWQE